jgi:hypothetical protein
VVKPHPLSCCLCACPCVCVRVFLGAQGEIDYDEFYAWWLAGGLNAGGDYAGMVGARSPALAELQVWLFRRGLADFTRCFLACGINAMTGLYELNHAKLTKLCIKDVGLNRKQADGVIKELMVRRDLLGYTSTDLITNAEEQRWIDEKKRKDKHRKRTLERRDWHNRLEVSGDAHGPTYHNTTHKPLSCFCLPASLDPVDTARERAKGRRHPQHVQTTRRSQIAPTAGNTRQSLSPTQRDSAQQLADDSSSGVPNSFAMTSATSLRPNLSGGLQESWSLPDISSSTSLAAVSSPARSIGSASPIPVNMFAAVASGGRRRSNHGRVSLSPKRRSPSRRRAVNAAASSPQVARQEARRQLHVHLEDSPSAGDAMVSLSYAHGGYEQQQEAPIDEGGLGLDASGQQQQQLLQQQQPKTMQDFIRHSRNPIREEYYLQGCPGL